MPDKLTEGRNFMARLAAKEEEREDKARAAVAEGQVRQAALNRLKELKALREEQEMREYAGYAPNPPTAQQRVDIQRMGHLASMGGGGTAVHVARNVLERHGGGGLLQQPGRYQTVIGQAESAGRNYVAEGLRQLQPPAPVVRSALGDAWAEEMAERRRVAAEEKARYEAREAAKAAKEAAIAREAQRLRNLEARRELNVARQVRQQDRREEAASAHNLGRTANLYGGTLPMSQEEYLSRQRGIIAAHREATSPEAYARQQEQARQARIQASIKEAEEEGKRVLKAKEDRAAAEAAAKAAAAAERAKPKQYRISKYNEAWTINQAGDFREL
jgi:hypothetical protein